MSGKFDLSETIRFFTGKLNAISGKDLELKVDIFDETVRAGDEVRARIIVRSPEKTRTLSYLLVSLSGQIQQNEKWSDYVRSAEVAHETVLVEGHEFVVPVVLKIPTLAVLSSDGGKWSVYARAYVDNSLDPNDESEFTVIHSNG